MIDHLDGLRRESQRFAACIRRGDFDSRVPTCPDWSLSDLAWHLTETQHFWGSIVGDLMDDPAGVEDLERPGDEQLSDLFGDRSRRLHGALSRREPGDRCWTWDDAGWTVGWVRRRQAHEALIHRVDAELTIGDRTPIEPELAADGIDELLSAYFGGSFPDWAEFTPDGTLATIAIDDGERHGLRFGRFVGTGPESGTEYDHDTFDLAEPAGTEVSGTAEALDVWLWGRGDTGVQCSDPAVQARIRSIVADATQ